MRHAGITRAMGRRIALLAALGDEPRDTGEEKLEHHYLIYMGLLMACGDSLLTVISALFDKQPRR